MRTTKLPDPKVNGNAVVSSKTLLYLPKRLKHYWRNFQQHQNYPQAGGSVKLAAGWLIDQCQLKGDANGWGCGAPSTGVSSH
ncbi:UDP-N-acetylenolpyruvoylglucosamine reductase [Escherichia coli]|uniref:UDP-N-acetylenolpyruvoylglucosamine reductase n=1 Tax=Escherichia coli TaxID=562 RepID=A0A2X3K6W7_ECOLX|nr:UDP-N-acetylenolpyruvoylglucosamine reductase [Escherichia coli]